MKDYIDYPFCTVIYSKDALVRQHKRCMFKGKSVRPDHDQVIDHVVWEHCGKGSGAFWTETNCPSKTRFCLQDIKDICKYNGVEFEQEENTIILTNICGGMHMEVLAIITERDGNMFITWEYAPFMHHNSTTPTLYMNAVRLNEHLITVMDMEQIKRMFDFNKL